jgi:hypothetical protein
MPERRNMNESGAVFGSGRQGEKENMVADVIPAID